MNTIRQKNFDSNLTATELFDKSSGEDRGGSSAPSKKRRGRDQWWPGQWWPPTRWSGYYDHHNGNCGCHGGRRGATDPGWSADHLGHLGHNNKAKDTVRDRGRYPRQESAASMRAHHEHRSSEEIAASTDGHDGAGCRTHYGHGSSEGIAASTDEHGGVGCHTHYGHGSSEEIAASMDGHGGADCHPEIDRDGCWSMWSSSGAGDKKVCPMTERPNRANPPVMGKDRSRHISRRLEALGNMHDREKLLHAYLYVPDGYELSLICVDSGCTVTNIDHDSIIPEDRRMSASRPISVATKDSEAIYPDYEG